VNFRAFWWDWDHTLADSNCWYIWYFSRFIWNNSSHCLAGLKCQHCTDTESHIVHTGDDLHRTPHIPVARTRTTRYQYFTSWFDPLPTRTKVYIHVVLVVKIVHLISWYYCFWCVLSCHSIHWIVWLVCFYRLYMLHLFLMCAGWLYFMFYVTNVGHISLTSSVVLCYNIVKLTYLLTKGIWSDSAVFAGYSVVIHRQTEHATKPITVGRQRPDDMLKRSPDNCLRFPHSLNVYVCMSIWTWLTFCLQCFDAVGWAAGRASGLKKLSDGVLAWSSVWGEVQICIWPSWCHCHSPALAAVNPDWFYLSGTGSPGYSPGQRVVKRVLLLINSVDMGTPFARHSLNGHCWYVLDAWLYRIVCGILFQVRTSTTANM